MNQDLNVFSISLISEDEQDSSGTLKYIPKFVGRTNEGDSVCIRVYGYKPYFFIKIKEELCETEEKIELFRNFIKDLFYNNYETRKKKQENLNPTKSWYYHDPKNYEGMTEAPIITVQENEIVYSEENNKKYKFLKLEFESEFHMIAFYKDISSSERANFLRTYPAWVQKKNRYAPIVEDWYEKYKTFYNNVIGNDIGLQMVIERDVQQIGWIQFKNCKKTKTNSKWDSKIRNSSAQEYCCHVSDIYKSERKINELPKNLVVCSYDIENQNETPELILNDENFDKIVNYPDNEIIDIGMHISRLNENKEECFVICQKLQNECEINVEGTELKAKFIPAKNEYEVIKQFVDKIEEYDVDFIIGFNTHSFDDKYIFRRLMLLLEKKIITEKESDDILLRFNRLRSQKLKLLHKDMSSSAIDRVISDWLAYSGRINFDLLKHYKKLKAILPMKSYKLDLIAEEEIGEHKIDLPYKEMWQLYREGTQPNIKKIAEYCIMDCILVTRLVKKRAFLIDLIFSANVKECLIDTLINFGQLMPLKKMISKYYSKLFKSRGCEHRALFQLQNYGKSDDEFKYQGANVFNSKRKYFPVKKISVADFAQLYPSIMIAYNLCFSAIITEKEIILKKIAKYLYEEFVLPLREEELAEYPDHFMTQQPKTVVLENGDTIMSKAQYGVKCYFLKEKGILPFCSEELSKLRAYYKNEMKKYSKNSVEYQIFDILQQNAKIANNSLYGMQGAKISEFYCKFAAALITYYGRYYFDMCHDYALNDFAKKKKLKTSVVYGDTDSIFIDFGLPIEKSDDEQHEIQRNAKLLIEYCDDMNKKINKAPIKLEPEKIIGQLMMFGPKMYAGVFYMNAPGNFTEPKYEIKGLKIKTRDSPLALETYGKKQLEMFFNKKSEKEIVDFCINNIKQIKYAKYEDLQCSMSFKGFTKADGTCYYKRETEGKLLVARRYAHNNPDIPLFPGDRIYFVHAKLNPENFKIIPFKWLSSDRRKNRRRAEKEKDILSAYKQIPTDYAKKHNFELDFEYYVTHKFGNVICKILSVLWENDKEAILQLEKIFERIFDKPTRVRILDVKDKKKPDKIKKVFAIDFIKKKQGKQEMTMAEYKKQEKSKNKEKEKET